MKNWLEKYFGFSQREFRGLYVLILLIGILSVIPTLLSWFSRAEQDQITEIHEQEITSFLTAVQSDFKKESYRDGEPSSPISVERVVDYFKFNPNELSIKEGLRLGLTERQTRMIQNYVAKGGRFDKKEDFKKIYAINESDYERLLPYIDIPKGIEKASFNNKNNNWGRSGDFKGASNNFAKSNDEANNRNNDPDAKSNNQNNETTNWTVKKELPKLSIELNQADTVELQKLRGIGPVFAARIVKHRDQLGGFHSTDQLLTVFGMDQERFDGIKDQVFADKTLIKKTRINEVDLEVLKKNPLFTYKQANAIVQFRKQHGKFVTINDLLKIALIDEEFLIKIAPYISFSE